MPIAIAAVPTSPVHEKDTARIDLTGLDASTRSYISAELAGHNALRSAPFVGASDGTGPLFSVIFPAAGTWAVKVRKVSDDSQLATQNVTVS